VRKIYEEKQSGLDKDRPQSARALDKVREGDVLVISKLDPAGPLRVSPTPDRRILAAEGAGLRVLDDGGIDTTSRPATRSALRMHDRFSQYDRRPQP
jgi:DNA invertase Pin-like site-specific DNA recombinase